MENPIQQLKSNTAERLNTRINMIREESRTISHRIAILEERRRDLQEEKKHFKSLLRELDG